MVITLEYLRIYFMGHLGDLVECPTLAQVMISVVHKFEPRVRLCADTSEPGACFGFCVSLSLSAPPPAHTLSLKYK